MLHLAPEMLADFPYFTVEETERINYWFRYYREKYDKEFHDAYHRGQWGFGYGSQYSNKIHEEMNAKERSALQAAGEYTRCL